MFKFDLGEELQDKLTGFTGIATSRTEWLTGCNRYGIESQQLKDGGVTSAEYFDENRLKKTGEGIRLKKDPSDPGGPQNDPRKPIAR